MDDDAGASSESPTLKQAPTKSGKGRDQIGKTDRIERGTDRIERGTDRMAECRKRRQTHPLIIFRGFYVLYLLHVHIFQRKCALVFTRNFVNSRVPTSKAPWLSLRKDFSAQKSEMNSRTFFSRRLGRWLFTKRIFEFKAFLTSRFPFEIPDFSPKSEINPDN